MAHAARVLLYFLFAGVGLTLLASALMWWFEGSRRLARAVNSALGHPADAIIYDLGGQKAAGLDFTAGDLAIMWKTGENGLVFTFEEIDGAELIVDEKVVARAQKGEPRRVLNETHAQASRVTLRLMFNDVETPEFEVNLFGEVSHHPVHAKTAAEAVRIGRKWLSHVDAVIKRLPADTTVHSEAAIAEREDSPDVAAVRAPVKKPTARPPWEEDEDDGNTDANDTFDAEKR